MTTKTAEFRFYEELNDFLPPDKRKVRFDHSFSDQPAIKDVIESLGVPHTEVDMILVNGESVDFTYLLQDHDQVSVYPVFETLNISPITHLQGRPLRHVQFIADVHLGKLARYLRLLGFNTSYEQTYSDKMMITIALDEQRIILTRDIGLLKNKKVTHGYWIRSTDPDQQIKEVLTRFDLFKQTIPFTRCLKCNGEIAEVAKDKIANQLQPKTKAYYDKFYICKHCQKIYWPGSHYERMQKFVERLLSAD